MLILYNSIFRKNNLINVIKIYKIKNYSKLNKQDLIKVINYYKCVIYIQQNIRKKFNEELICPITLTALKYPFICIKNYNKFRYYSLIEFIEYLNKSNNDLRDPLTRELLSDSSLKQIEYLIKYYKIKKVWQKKIWDKKINSRSEFLIITNCLNQIINYIFTINELNFNFIYTFILPQFIYYFQFLLQNHKNNCYSIIINYINCLNHHCCNNKIYLIDFLNLIISSNNL